MCGAGCSSLCLQLWTAAAQGSTRRDCLWLPPCFTSSGVTSVLIWQLLCCVSAEEGDLVLCEQESGKEAAEQGLHPPRRPGLLSFLVVVVVCLLFYVCLF